MTRALESAARHQQGGPGPFPGHHARQLPGGRGVPASSAALRALQPCCPPLWPGISPHRMLLWGSCPLAPAWVRPREALAGDQRAGREGGGGRPPSCLPLSHPCLLWLPPSSGSCPPSPRCPLGLNVLTALPCCWSPDVSPGLAGFPPSCPGLCAQLFPGLSPATLPGCALCFLWGPDRIRGDHEQPPTASSVLLPLVLGWLLLDLERVRL